MASVSALWFFFAAVPMVVEIADPLIKTGAKTYGTVHDTVVVSMLPRAACPVSSVMLPCMSGAKRWWLQQPLLF